MLLTFPSTTQQYSILLYSTALCSPQGPPPRGIAAGCPGSTSRCGTTPPALPCRLRGHPRRTGGPPTTATPAGGHHRPLPLGRRWLLLPLLYPRCALGGTGDTVGGPSAGTEVSRGMLPVAAGGAPLADPDGTPLVAPGGVPLVAPRGVPSAAPTPSWLCCPGCGFCLRLHGKLLFCVSCQNGVCRQGQNRQGNTFNSIPGH